MSGRATTRPLVVLPVRRHRPVHPLGRAAPVIRRRFRTGRPTILAGAGLAVAILGSSCAAITHVPGPEPAAAPTGTGIRSWQTDPVFGDPLRPVEMEIRPVSTGPTYQVQRLIFPSISGNGQPGDLVTVDYHRSNLPGSHPAVIVLPIWGREVYPSNAVTRTIRKRSDGRLHVLNVLGTGFLIDWFRLATVTDEDEFVKAWVEGADHEVNTIIDIRRLIDWAEGQPEIDAGRIGLIGFSHGAMLGPTATTQEPRIKATVLIMGGADPHTVIARCVGARTETVQDWAAEEFGWSRDELEARLEPIYRPVNPASYPGHVDPGRVLIFEAGRDECMPPSARDGLWEAMGRPERYIIDRSHRRSFYSMTPLRLNWMRKRMWRFLESRLLEQPVPRAGRGGGASAGSP